MSHLIRLQKVLAERGVASRRKAEILIQEGRVSVNGQIITKMGTKIDPSKAKIEVDGTIIKGPAKTVFIMLNKPKGYLSTVRDERGRKTILDLIPQKKLGRLWPCGRLDKDTTGLILLTNDGDLGLKLTHPKFGVEKTYLVQVKDRVSEKELASLRRGIVIEGRRTRPARVILINSNSLVTNLKFIIREGRKRQIRLMCRAVKHPVIKLKRIQYGSLKLDNLKESFWRSLTKDEVLSLKKEAEKNN